MVLQKVITKLLDKLTVSIIFCLTVTLRLPIIGFTTLIEEMDAHDDVAACQPKIFQLLTVIL